MNNAIFSVENDIKKLEQKIIEAYSNSANIDSQKKLATNQHPILSAKELLSIGSTEHQNSVALDNERFFELRFKFSLPSKKRPHIINLQSQLDLTDSEISNMASSKVIKFINGRSTIVESERTLFYTGWIMIALLCIRFSTISALLLLSDISAMNAFFGLIISITLWGALTFVCYNYSIRPIKSLKRCGLKLGESLIYNGHYYVRE
tara:strand:- start:2788 stop:3405 length:618 start_codon:yes stop_codon:yes gene_type:complete